MEGARAELIVFRHGQSDFNAKGIFTGWMESSLTEKGVEECREVGRQLRGQRVTRAFQSDQARSQQTLAVVLEEMGLSDVPVETDPRIKERSYGDISGKDKAEIKRQHPNEFEAWHRSYSTRPPDGRYPGGTGYPGECIQDVELRVLHFLKGLATTIKDGDVILLSMHGNSLRPLRGKFEGISKEEMCSFEHPRAKVYRYEVVVRDGVLEPAATNAAALVSAQRDSKNQAAAPMPKVAAR